MAFTEAQLQPYLESIKSNWYYTHNASYQQTIEAVEQYLTGHSSQIPSLSNSGMDYNIYQLVDLLNDPWNWTANDELLMQFITTPKNWGSKTIGNWYGNGFGYSFFQWIGTVIHREGHQDTLQVILPLLSRYNIPEDDIFLTNLMSANGHLCMSENGKVTSLGKYFLSLLPTKLKSLTTLAQKDNTHYWHWLDFLLVHQEPLVNEHLPLFLKENDDSLRNLQKLLEINPNRYEVAIASYAKTLKSVFRQYRFYKALGEPFPGKYDAFLLAKGYAYLEAQQKEANAYVKQSKWDQYWEKEYFYNYQTNSYVFPSVDILDQLLQKDYVNSKSFAHEYIRHTQQLRTEILHVIERNCKEESVDILADAMHIAPEYADADYYRTLFTLLSKYDYSRHEEKVWALIGHKQKRFRELTAVTLAKLGEPIIPRAAKLLQSTKADIRQMGALMLSLVKSDEAKHILSEAVDTEKSDETRDTMIQSLSEFLYADADAATVDSMIEKARKRGKLAKPVESWLEEATLPSLRLTSGHVASHEWVRFLLYRMSRSKEMRPDPEAKVALAFIDRTHSGAFAQHIFSLFIQKGADAKQKYLMTLAALLGDDNLVVPMRKQIDEWATNTLRWVEDDKGTYSQTGQAARIKMAEYGVMALALNGSNKSLRTVEFLSRKYRAKNKNIGIAALEAFHVAAEELGISIYELADSIIPDFGFEGLFRVFEVKGETYRAFIDNQFKLAYFDEDNKKLKSPPKGTPKELQDEFKEIGKEVRDIVKSQSDRMQQYLVIQRKWEAEAWQAFFLNNPIMFVYAAHIIWGVYDVHGTLIHTFQCMEDTTLVNEADEEFDMPDNLYIGMVHPLSLPAATIEFWQQRLLDSDLTPIFPQLSRPVHGLEEKDRHLRMSKAFAGKKMSPYQFVKHAEKQGWGRGSVQDGGWVSFYIKRFPEAGIDAFIEVQGIVVGYLEQEGTLGRFYFTQSASVATGSYVYDEPSDEKDIRLLPFETIPTIIYSEVLADLKAVIIEEEKNTPELV